MGSQRYLAQELDLGCKACGPVEFWSRSRAGRLPYSQSLANSQALPLRLIPACTDSFIWISLTMLILGKDMLIFTGIILATKNGSYLYHSCIILLSFFNVKCLMYKSVRRDSMTPQ